MLQHRALGDTGIRISPISLGTVKIGRNEQVKYPTPFAIPDDKAVLELLAKARDLGINCLDTAPSYGNSEQRLGKLLGNATNDWVICTKAGEEFIDGKSRFDFSPEAVKRSVERSLQRLHRDELDIVLIHSDGNDLDIINELGTLDALDDLKKAGMIRATGMSTKTVTGGIAALEKADIVMATYNLQDQSEKPVLDFAETHNKGVFIKKGLASGHACAGYTNDPVQASLELILSHPGVTSITIGTIQIPHLVKNAEKAARVLASLSGKV